MTRNLSGALIRPSYVSGILNLLSMQKVTSIEESTSRPKLLNQINKCRQRANVD